MNSRRSRPTSLPPPAPSSSPRARPARRPWPRVFGRFLWTKPGEKTWWADENEKVTIARLLEQMGPSAAVATPELIALCFDDGCYRDTRYGAERALVAIGVAAVDALCARGEREPLGFGEVHLLAGFKAEDLAASLYLVPRLAEVLRSSDTDLLWWAAKVSRRVGAGSAPLLPALLALLDHPRRTSGFLRSTFADAVGAAGPEGVAALRRVALGGQRSASWHAAASLGLSVGVDPELDPIFREGIRNAGRSFRKRLRWIRTKARPTSGGA